MVCSIRKRIFWYVLLAFISTAVYSQTITIEQLKQKAYRLQQTPGFKKDTAYLNILNQIAFAYADSSPDSALALLQTNAGLLEAASHKQGIVESYKIRGNAYNVKGNYTEALNWYQQSYALAKKVNYHTALPGILNNIANIYMSQGNYDVALDKYYEALQLADADNNKFVQMRTLNNIATVRFYQGNMSEADNAYTQTLQLAREMNDTSSIILYLNNLAEVNLEEKKLTAALQNLLPAYHLATVKNIPDLLVVVTQSLGNVYLQIDSAPKATTYFKTALQIARQKDLGRSSCKALIGLAKAYKQQKLLDSALTNGLEGLQKAEELQHSQLQRDANEVVAGIYEAMGNDKEALFYFKKYKIFSDSLTRLASEHAAANYKANYEFAKKEQVLERRNLQQQWIAFSALAALALLGIILLIVNRNKRRLNHTYKQLQHKNTVIELQREKAEKTLTELKSMQAQLVQSEKMASLGEMAAGIAHEIQNPLNFVNNFSEVSQELIDEMVEEVQNGNTEDIEAIVTDLKQNMEKINFHGKRADSIVKSMLQHSRQKQGVKEPTDINALCDESVRLSYHGLRARDKDFNADFKTSFDEAVGKVKIVSQDTMRVLINLLSNAFYAVNEKKKSVDHLYKPMVLVQTKNHEDVIEISIQDNGSGISKAHLDKVFQPFFTTKPSGQGTGLGLSISYDIIKTQGGSISVDSREGEGSTFVITLPRN